MRKSKHNVEQKSYMQRRTLMFVDSDHNPPPTTADLNNNVLLILKPICIMRE